MGSAFPAEPREWFSNYDGERLMFPMIDPSIVQHARTGTCAETYPHPTKDCGYFPKTADRSRR
jgi:hypothetical protein